MTSDLCSSFLVCALADDNVNDLIRDTVCRVFEMIKIVMISNLVLNQVF